MACLGQPRDSAPYFALFPALSCTGPRADAGRVHRPPVRRGTGAPALRLPRELAEAKDIKSRCSLNCPNLCGQYKKAPIVG